MVRVVIISAVRFYRESLAQALAGRNDIQVVGTASPGPDAVTIVAELRPDLVLADSNAVRGTDLVARIHQVASATRVIALALNEEDEQEVLACAEAGLAGFVAAAASLDELPAVIEAAARGGPLLTADRAAPSPQDR